MKTPRHLSRPALLTSLLLLAFLAQAATPFQASARLDKRLAQIADAAAQRVDAPLRDAALARQASRLISPLEAHWNAEGQVQVYLHYDRNGAAPDMEQLAALGATSMIDSKRLGVIQAWLPAAELPAAADLPGVVHVGLPRYALHKQVPVLGPTYAAGKIDTQGDTLLHASTFRHTTGITGQGTVIGVISDGDDHIASSQASRDLPANIWDDPKDKGGSGNFSPASTGDEGTAMMEIVYDLAPGVKQLGFCGPNTSVEFITCLDDFQSNISPDVIVDDLGFPGGAMFSDDNFTDSVDSFAKANPSIHLVTAAGNDGTAFWQGNWAPTPVTTTVNGVSYTQAQNFDTSGGTTPYLQIQPLNVGDTLAYVVEWADPWDDAATKDDPNDYDVVVFDNPSSDPTGAVACNQGINIGPTGNGTKCNQHNTESETSPGPQPVQGSAWTTNQSDYYLEVFLRHGNPSRRIKILVFDLQGSQVVVTPSTQGGINGHAALSSETTVGAVFSGDLTLESYSSTGPVERGTGSQAVTELMKPDFVAPDCVNATGAGGFQIPFCGTSAAAPHIAGLMALLLSGYPGQSPYTLLKESADQPGSRGLFGFGLPNMQTLLDKGLFPSPTVTITAPGNNASVDVNQAETFSGKCVAHGSGTPKYAWNFGTGSGIADVKAATAHVTFTKTGTYQVTLTCTTGSVTGTSNINVSVSSPSSGGGEFDVLSLLALGLAWARRRR
jgi:MYXO-CTERM domain-containing protein